jgi:hypothetical protein
MRASLDRNPTTFAEVGRARIRSTPGRIAAVLTGGLLALGSLGLVAVGAYMLSAAASNGGWLDLGHTTYVTDSYAVTTDPVDWGKQTYALGNVATVRIRVTPSNATTPVFVGMAGAEDVERYLSGVQHVTAHEAPGAHVTYSRHGGRAPSTPPAQAVPWTVQATGTGTQTVEFVAHQQPDDQVLVVMNADGSPSLRGSAESIVTQPSLSWIGSGFLVGGIVLAFGALLLIRRGARRN